MSMHTTKNASSGKGTYSFYDDDDTGIDSDAANQVDIITGGTVAATFDSSQNMVLPDGSSLEVDTINEATAAAGVTIDSVVVKDAGITMAGTLSVTGGAFRTPQVWALSSVVSSIAGTTTAAGFFTMSNPFGAACLVTDITFDLQTAATSATATVDIGTNANSNSSADNLLDGLDLTQAVGFYNGITDSGTNGLLMRSWASDAFITGSVKTGDVSASVGVVYVTAVQVSA